MFVMTERHKQILLAVGIAALVWIVLVCYLSGGCDAAHMELIALDGDAHQGLIRQPEGQAVAAVGFVGFGLGEWRSFAAELRRAPLVNSTPAYSTARSARSRTVQSSNPRAALIAQESAISGGASS